MATSFKVGISPKPWELVKLSTLMRESTLRMKEGQKFTVEVTRTGDDLMIVMDDPR